MYEEILYDTDGPAATIRINRPDKLNALTYKTIREVNQALAAAEQDPSVTGIILTGEGRGFCAGMDMDVLGGIIKEGRTSSRVDAESIALGDAGAMGADFSEGLTRFLKLRKPVIAAINGPCAGFGLSLALFCDLRFISEDAKITPSFSGLGLVAEHGQSWILPRLIGPEKALDFFWRSPKMSGAEAVEFGLGSRLCPADALIDIAKDYIRELAAKASPTSLMLMKQQVYKHLNRTLGPAMEETNILMAQTVAGDDFREGVAAFTERRAPRFNALDI